LQTFYVRLGIIETRALDTSRVKLGSGEELSSPYTHIHIHIHVCFYYLALIDYISSALISSQRIVPRGNQYRPIHENTCMHTV